MIAPARYCGFQQGYGRAASVHLYTLTDDIPGHPKGSTVSDWTLTALGYEIPRSETPCSECEGTLGFHSRGCQWPL